MTAEDAASAPTWQATATAAPLAVYGTYTEVLESEESPVKRGLRRGEQPFITLASSIGHSSVPTDGSVFIWVDLHRAMVDGQLIFYEAADGRILTIGDEAGCLPPQFLQMTIQLSDALAAPGKQKVAQLSLMEWLYAGSTLIRVSKLHGGFSGSLVLAVDGETSASSAVSNSRRARMKPRPRPRSLGPTCHRWPAGRADCT